MHRIRAHGRYARGDGGHVLLDGAHGGEQRGREILAAHLTRETVVMGEDKRSLSMSKGLLRKGGRCSVLRTVCTS